ncbi:hypothetical protein VP01_5232g1 [Puccinia sorghi]|uniref:Uncharacterized protein n=1 Tax=Puccinia sorghi TaxID=27349 RepID=A0A0L6UKK7_9BASI|nr:hypothetical protein VP01_5232g1 [Puccinia sorghi]
MGSFPRFFPHHLPIHVQKREMWCFSEQGLFGQCKELSNKSIKKHNLVDPKLTKKMDKTHSNITNILENGRMVKSLQTALLFNFKHQPSFFSGEAPAARLSSQAEAFHQLKEHHECLYVDFQQQKLKKLWLKLLPFWRHSFVCIHCALQFFQELGPRLENGRDKAGGKVVEVISGFGGLERVSKEGCKSFCEGNTGWTWESKGLWIGHSKLTMRGMRNFKIREDTFLRSKYKQAKLWLKRKLNKKEKSKGKKQLTEIGGSKKGARRMKKRQRVRINGGNDRSEVVVEGVGDIVSIYLSIYIDRVWLSKTEKSFKSLKAEYSESLCWNFFLSTHP